MVLKCIRGASWIGCEDGTLAVLDGIGELIRKSSVRGRPTCIEGVSGGVLLGTEAGEVSCLSYF